MNKTLRFFSIFVFTFLLAGTVLAQGLDDTRWSTRGKIGLDEVEAFDGAELSSARGKVNAHFREKYYSRRDQTIASGSGAASVQAKDVDGARHRVSLNWKSREVYSCSGYWRSRTCGDYGGFTVVSNTATETVFTTPARLIVNRNVEYGVETQITYDKVNEVLTVETLDGRYKFTA